MTPATRRAAAVFEAGFGAIAAQCTAPTVETSDTVHALQSNSSMQGPQWSGRLTCLSTHLDSKEAIMKVHQLFAASALALAATVALAGSPSDTGSSLTRAEVRQSVIAARNAGELIPAGEGAYAQPQPSKPSTLTRSAVREEVRVARAAGELIPAGEGDDAFFARTAPLTFSGLTRAEVNAATLRARDAGELIPAGPFDTGSLARERAQAQYARAAWKARHPAPVVAAGE